MVQSKPEFRRLDTNASLLVSVPKHKRITLSFKNVSAHVPVLVTPGVNPGGEDASTPETPSEKGAPQKKDGSTSDAPVKERQVLFDVNGTVDPGQILALMGPSGSGKSSLLSVLGGRSTARITGSILFNDKPMNKAMKRNMGFVTQDDLLYAELTTFETLYYAALLRLPRHWSKEDKMERVEMVIQGLGLGKCRDTIIGNQMMRGVSGGERKRVSIGHELLINPSVILLDEPTSGLDSTTALKLIHTLRSLASGGRTIIASIHQPSSRLYQEMDQLMLLSDGRIMFYGEATSSTVTWFSKQGVPVPLGVSTPDHLLDLACGDLPNRSMADSKKVQLQLLDAFEHRTVGRGEHGIQPSDLGAVEKQRYSEEDTGMHTRDLVDGAQEGTSSPEDDASGKMPLADKGHIELHVAEALQGQGITHQAEVAIPSSGAGPDAAEGDGKWGATWPEQIRILTSRCIRVRRFQALSIQRIAEVILVAILAGLFWFQVGGKDQLTSRKIQDISGLLFFQIVLQSFSAMFAALFAFPADFQMLIKERQSGMYRLTSYYFARSISDIPMDCLMPTIFVIILYWMAGLRIAAGSFFCNWLSTLLTMLVAQSLGLLISATIMNPKTSMAAATVFMLCIMLVGGYFVQSIPIWIRWLRYASFVYYGYNLLVKIEFVGRGYSCADYYQNHPDAAPGLTWCPIDGSGAVSVNVDEPVTLEVCVLIGMLIVVRVLVYVALKQKTTFKTKKVKEA